MDHTFSDKSSLLAEVGIGKLRCAFGVWKASAETSCIFAMNIR